MKQVLGGCKIDIRVDKDTSNESEASRYFFTLRVYCALKTALEGKKKISEKMILQDLHAQTGIPLTEKIALSTKVLLAQTCEAGILTVDENGYYSLA